ncbi:MAG TPA: hypothetical protein PK299_09900 [Anaerolineales bacterium]|nr:hypothetical protein [Anaerolineales bacterium]
MLLFRRIFAIAIIIFSAVGILLSIAGVIIVWRAKPVVINAVTNGIAPLQTSLQATYDGLVVAAGSLDTARLSVGSVTDITDTLATTLSDTGPGLSASADLLGTTLPESLQAAQDGISAAATGAQAIDATLATLSSVNIFGTKILPVEYDPEKPMSESLENINESLSDLPESFGTLEETLRSASTNLTTLEGQIEDLGTNIGAIDTSLQDTQKVLVTYQGVVKGLQGNLEGMEINLPVWLNYLFTGLTILLIWLGITQIGLLAQGLEMYSKEWR